MATQVAPFGLRPVRTMSGAPWTGAVMQCLTPAADGTAIFVGDLVKNYGSSAAAGVTVNGIDCTGMLYVIQGNHATSTVDVVGVVVGFLPDPAGGLDNTNSYRKASTLRIALVSVGPDTIYEIQEDAVGGNWGATDIGGMGTLVATTGNTTTGRSKMTLDSDTAATTTNTLPIKVLGLSRKVGMTYGTSTTDAAIYECVLNSTTFQLAPAGLAR